MIEIDEECNKIFNFWKLEEIFTPLDYPELEMNVKEGNKVIQLDTYHNEYGNQNFPLYNYKSYNKYLVKKNVSEDKQYNRVNIYCGNYDLRNFVETMIASCNLDLEKYENINELKGRFYIFSVQIDLEGKITDEGVRISPFFYAMVKIIKKKSVNEEITQEEITKLNEGINEIIHQNMTNILEFSYVMEIKQIIFDKLGISSEDSVGLKRSTKKNFACKGLRKEEESSDLNSFYLEDIEKIQKNYKNNTHLVKYVKALLLNEQKKIIIDKNLDKIKEWLDADRYPMAKYPSKFSPTLMQQVAINIAISEKDRRERIFSVNGPPGTGKTTLLKEIIASNIEKLAEVLIKYGVNGNNFKACTIESVSNQSYVEKYYEIPKDIAQYGILVVSNNNIAVENISLDLPKSEKMLKNETRTTYFDRNEHQEVYFSAVADKLLGKQGSAWGLISARMGRKQNISNVLDSCIFAKKNDDSDKITLDLAKNESVSWETAVLNYKKAKEKVISIRKEIKKDQCTLTKMYKIEEELIRKKIELEKKQLNIKKIKQQLSLIEKELERNERNTLEYEEEIEYINNHASFIDKILIIIHLGKYGKQVKEKKILIEELVLKHETISRKRNDVKEILNEKCEDEKNLNEKISKLREKLNRLRELVYGNSDSLKTKYGANLTDSKFYKNIEISLDLQNACPWTFDEYDQAREELFFAALQVRKAFILESPYIRRNLFVYEAYNNGKYTTEEKAKMFPHLFNALSVVIPVISSTFASVGRFLKYADNESLGMLVIDEAGQAIPQSALGSIYRTKCAIVVGDPLQVEPVITIPEVLIDILANSTGIAKEYRTIENSVQIFADNMNEFCGMIGNRQVGCPLVVHRRCIEPMFSISNMISYDNRMLNKTETPNKPFLIKESGWYHIKGEEKGDKNHFVIKQAEIVCKLLEDANSIYENVFETYENIFVITPFRTVAEEMRKFIKSYFQKKGYGSKLLETWTKTCVGTVHTFQGKGANEVLFVLGCSEKSQGAINWVVKKANIINVACTRAKYRIAFIGDIDIWRDKNYFREFIPKLIHIINP